MILYKYIRREILVTSGIILSILGLIALGSAFLELASNISSGHLFATLLLLLLLQVPRLLVIILPISFFAGIVLTYSRMFVNGQMVVWQISGVKFSQFIRLLMVPTIVMSVGLLIVQGWGIPYCALKEKQILNNFDVTTFISTLQAGRFHIIPKQNKMIYVGNINSRTGKLNDVFIANVAPKVISSPISPLKKNRAMFNVIRAQSAEFQPHTNTLLLNHGTIYDGNAKNNVLLKFDTYAMQIVVHQNKPIIASRNTLTLTDLWHSKKSIDKIELIWQIGCAMNLLSVLLLAVPLSYVSVRQNINKTLFLALFAVLAYWNVMILAKHWLDMHWIPLFYGIWWVQLLMVMIAFLYFSIRIQFFRRIFFSGENNEA